MEQVVRGLDLIEAWQQGAIQVIQRLEEKGETMRVAMAETLDRYEAEKQGIATLIGQTFESHQQAVIQGRQENLEAMKSWYTNYVEHFRGQKEEPGDLKRIAEQGYEEQRGSLTDMADAIQVTLEQKQVQMAELEERTKAAFETHAKELRRHTVAGIALAETTAKLEERRKDMRIEAIRVADTGGSSRGHDRGYLPRKSLIPATFDNDLRAWRNWKEGVVDFLEFSNKGVNKVLKAAEVHEEEVDEKFRDQMELEFGGRAAHDHEEVWRTLKYLTQGEARRVVLTVRDMDGFQAWRNLVMYFERGITAKLGLVLREFFFKGVSRKLVYPLLVRASHLCIWCPTCIPVHISALQPRTPSLHFH